MNADGANNDNAAEEGNGIDVGILNGAADQEEQPSNYNSTTQQMPTNNKKKKMRIVMLNHHHSMMSIPHSIMLIIPAVVVHPIKLTVPHSHLHCPQH